MLKTVHGVVGSLELLGNPTGLFSNVVDGIEDFVVEPMKGITHGPLGLGKVCEEGITFL